MCGTLNLQVPSYLSFDQAASSPASLISASHALYTDYVPSIESGGANLTPFWREGGDKKYVGQSIVILGGSSANGQYGRFSYHQ